MDAETVPLSEQAGKKVVPSRPNSTSPSALISSADAPKLGGKSTLFKSSNHAYQNNFDPVTNFAPSSQVIRNPPPALAG
jgi:hypothetical protein